MIMTAPVALYALLNVFAVAQAAGPGAETPPPRPGSDLTRSLNSGVASRDGEGLSPPATASTTTRRLQPTAAPQTAAPVLQQPAPSPGGAFTRSLNSRPAQPPVVQPEPVRSAPVEPAPDPVQSRPDPVRAVPPQVPSTDLRPVEPTQASVAITRSLNSAPAGVSSSGPIHAPASVAPPQMSVNTVQPAPRPSAQQAPPGALPPIGGYPPAGAVPPTPSAAPRAAERPQSSAPAQSNAPAAAQPVSSADLPFRIDLPEGFRVERGRSGPGFAIYQVMKGAQIYLMVYSGPASQFPIYDGELVEMGDRASIVVTEGDRRIAMEHLFRRDAAPRELHIWIASSADDRAAAEEIGQSIDPL